MGSMPAMEIQVNGVELEYVDEGHGTAVVFSHGGGSDMRYWEPQREAFAARYRFVAYSHRFHGRRAWPDEGDYSAQAHAADLVALIGNLEAGPVHLVGFSSAIALRAALLAPGLVRSLIVIEPNVPWLMEGNAADEAILAAWRDANDRVRTTAGGDAEQRARLWFELVNNQGSSRFDEQAPAFRRMWLDNFGRASPATPSPQPLTPRELSAIDAPTLALGAEFGMSYSRRILEVLSGCIPNARLRIIPSATHFMSYQAPNAFNAAVMEFLAQH